MLRGTGHLFSAISKGLEIGNRFLKKVKGTDPFIILGIVLHFEWLLLLLLSFHIFPRKFSIGKSNLASYNPCGSNLKITSGLTESENLLMDGSS